MPELCETDSMDKKNLLRLSKRPLWNQFPELYTAIVTILFQYDPVGICDDSNATQETEYAPEVDTLLPRLKEAASLEELLQIVHEEFVFWFGISAGPIERYEQVAADIWKYIGTPEQHEQIAKIPADLPKRVLSAIANVLARYPDADSQDKIRVAEALRTYADHLEGFERATMQKSARK